MKTKIIISLLILTIIACTNPEQQQQPKVETLKINQTGSLETDIKTLLPEGKYTVEIIDIFKYNSRFKILAAKQKKAIAKNEAWFIERVTKEQETGKKYGYHPNFGMPESEYKEYEDLLESGLVREMSTSGFEEIRINYSDDYLTFKPNKTLEILKYLKINLKEQSVWVDSIELNPYKELNVDRVINNIKTNWKGYTWKYIETDSGNEIDFTQPILYLFSCSFSIGLLEEDNSIFVQISCREIIDGERVTDINIPFKLIKD